MLEANSDVKHFIIQCHEKHIKENNYLSESHALPMSLKFTTPDLMYIKYY